MKWTDPTIQLVSCGQSGWNEWDAKAIDALAFATYLNIFIRGCTMVHMANLAQMVNVIAPIFTSKEGLFLQTIYHPLKLYSDYMQGSALDVYVESERYDRLAEHETSFWEQRVADLGPFQLLDVAATYDESNSQITLAVVTLHLV